MLKIFQYSVLPDSFLNTFLGFHVERVRVRELSINRAGGHLGALLLQNTEKPLWGIFRSASQ